jgi:hypothetical protein
MANFKGKNSIRSTRYLAQQRAKYKTEAFPENGGLGPEQITDFTFAEKVLYGRVNQSLNPVIPLNDFIVPLPSGNPGSNPSAIDFVADALTEVMLNFRLAVRVRNIPADDPYLSKIEVFRGYESPIIKYQTHIEEVMSFFNLMFLTGDYLDEVFTIDQYVSALVKFSDQYKAQLPLTLSGFHLSRDSDVFSSGLAFDISGLAHDVDESKEDLFINNPIFDYYSNVAKQHGFSVSKNVPWVLVADLASPGMKVYKEARGLSSVADIFSTRYQRTSELDIDFLRDAIFLFYNMFATSNSYTKILKVCDGRTKSEIKRRYPISRATMDNNINDNIILHLYISIRNNEEGSPYKTADLNLMNKNAKKIKDSLDMETAISYIEEQYRSIRKFKPGGLNSVIKKQKDKEHKERFGTDRPVGGGY